MTHVTDEVDNPVLAKSQKLHTDGMLAIEKGEFKLFTGYAPDVSNRYTVAGMFDNLFDNASGNGLISALINHASLVTGVDLYITNRDFPLHTTIGEAVVPEGMKLDHMHGQYVSFKGGMLVFSELVMQGSNVLLTTASIPDWFQKLRDDVNKAYTVLGFKPLPIENLLHITLARITKGERSAVSNFAQHLCVAREEVKEEPICLTLDKLFKGSSINFLNSKPL